MTPDSLEVQRNESTNVPCFLHEKGFPKNEGVIEYSAKENEAIYAKPRCIIPNEIQSSSIHDFKSNRISEGEEKSDYFKVNPLFEESGVKSMDIFVDSLEPFAETSTTF